MSPALTGRFLTREVLAHVYKTPNSRYPRHIWFVIFKEHRVCLPFLSWPPEGLGQSCAWSWRDVEATSLPPAGIQRGPESLQRLAAASESRGGHDAGYGGVPGSVAVRPWGIRLGAWLLSLTLASWAAWSELLPGRDTLAVPGAPRKPRKVSKNPFILLLRKTSC